MRIFIVGSLVVWTTGCVRLFRDPDAWWFASITDVVRQSQIPPKVDRYCLSVSGKAGKTEDATVLIASIQLGRRMPRYKQAFPLEDGPSLHAGDSVLVQPRSCRVKLAGS
ncbi:hypothetical protein UUC_04891 [Rhodanobacter denitrificans]|jgi:hypothetical protein|nr:hypothetical protein UUC_04891 [Rhodanobacter denitrificans]